MEITRWNSLVDAKIGLEKIRNQNRELGSIHTLGALHEGHGKLIQLAATENEKVVVTIYPNIKQLLPGSTYNHNLEADCEFAAKHGATHLITPNPEEMYDDSYRTFLNQGEQYARLDGEVTPHLFEGMITMTIRWLILVQPKRSYFGLKDIGQVILVKRAVEDLFINTEIKEVPCVRFKSGMAISSRMFNNPKNVVLEFNRAYHALEAGRKFMADGCTNSKELIVTMLNTLDPQSLKYFNLQYIKVAKPLDFVEPEDAEVPIIFQIVMKLGERNWFESFFLRTEKELQEGPETIWLDAFYPPFK